MTRRTMMRRMRGAPTGRGWRKGAVPWLAPIPRQTGGTAAASSDL